MKTIAKSSLFIIMISLLTIGQLYSQHHRGQQGPPPVPDEEQIDQMVVDLSETLSLNEEQEKQVKKAYTDHFEEVAQIRERSRKYREAQREEMEKIRNSFNDEVKSYLNEEQKLQYDAYQKGRQSKHHMRREKGKRNKMQSQ